MFYVCYGHPFDRKSDDKGHKSFFGTFGNRVKFGLGIAKVSLSKLSRTWERANLAHEPCAVGQLHIVF